MEMKTNYVTTKKAEIGTNIEEHATAQKDTNNNRNITILADSIIKEMKALKMKQGMSQKDKVFIKSFPGATVECMTDYTKPSMEFNINPILYYYIVEQTTYVPKKVQKKFLSV